MIQNRFLCRPVVPIPHKSHNFSSEPLKDNILMGLPDDPEALDRAIRLGVMEEDLPTLENGLDTVVGPRGVKLSGGQIQRAAATRMFIRACRTLCFR